MATIAQGTITLTSVNDAYSVLLSPGSCVINADYNGANPKLEHAYADVRVVRGDTAVPFTMRGTAKSHPGIIAHIQHINDTTKRIVITSVPETELAGDLTYEVSVGDDFVTTGTFQYTVVRETSMLKWILDWNGTYTQIGSEWIISPKLFVGTHDGEDPLNSLSGIYLGPALSGIDRYYGIYGLQDGQNVFQITEADAYIGGWKISPYGIEDEEGVLRILSEGSIISAPNGEMAWELKKDGSASFAAGKVQFKANGDASFEGQVTSGSGKIGGWEITEHTLHNGPVMLSSEDSYIGVRAGVRIINIGEPTSSTHYENVKIMGGVVMHYESAASYGIEGWVPNYNAANLGAVGYKTFSLGSTNLIAGWSFDQNSIYRGTKVNTARNFTASSGDITIGSNGLRGLGWYIDSDGEISFANQTVHFTKDGGKIGGWTLNPDCFATSQAALVSVSGYTGLYLANSALPENYSSYEGHIINKGGIFLITSSSGARLQGRDSTGQLLFQLTGSVSFIGGWWFTNKCLFTGASSAPVGQFATEGDITLSPDGLRGYKFRLEADGSGKLAGGLISWEADGSGKLTDNITWKPNGEITLGANVKIQWASINGGPNLTYLDSSGIYTGVVNADKITTGTISSVDIKQKDNLWALNQNGSGHLAGGNITWDEDGNTNIKGLFSQDIVRLCESDAVISNIQDNDPILYTAKLNKDLYLLTNSLKQLDSEDNELAWANATIILPTDTFYIGKEVRVYDANFGPYSRTSASFASTIIKSENGYIEGLPPIYASTPQEVSGFEYVEVMGGYMTFVGLPGWNINTQTACTLWLCTGFNGASVNGWHNGVLYSLSHNFNTTA